MTHQFSDITLVDRRGWVLMQERGHDAPTDPLLWGLPGGNIEDGEKPAQTAVRELEEETGLTSDQVPPLRLLGRFRFLNPACGGEDTQSVFVTFTDVVQGQVVCGEGRQMVFVDPTEAVNLPLAYAARIGLSAVFGCTEYRERFGEAAINLDWGLPGKKPHRFAGVLARDAAEGILLQERDANPRLDPLTWGLAGGHVEDGESFLEAAYREFAEETGCELSPGDLQFWREFAVDHLAGYGTVDQMQIFVVKPALAQSDIECHEGLQITFVPRERVLDLDLSRAAAVIMPEFLGSS